jgi:hypothetical protein
MKTVKIITTRVSEEEYNYIEAKAKKEFRTVSAYVRAKILKDE